MGGSPEPAAPSGAIGAASARVSAVASAAAPSAEPIREPAIPTPHPQPARARARHPGVLWIAAHRAAPVDIGVGRGIVGLLRGTPRAPCTGARSGSMATAVGEPCGEPADIARSRTASSGAARRGPGEIPVPHGREHQEARHPADRSTKFVAVPSAATR